jgi:hypothetical protein
LPRENNVTHLPNIRLSIFECTEIEINSSYDVSGLVKTATKKKEKAKKEPWVMSAREPLVCGDWTVDPATGALSGRG